MSEFVALYFRWLFYSTPLHLVRGARFSLVEGAEEISLRRIDGNLSFASSEVLKKPQLSRIAPTTPRARSALFMGCGCNPSRTIFFVDDAAGFISCPT